MTTETMDSKCPLCGTIATKTLTSKLRRGTGVVLFCEPCNHGFLTGNYSQEQLKEYYAEEYRKEYSHLADVNKTNAKEIFNTYEKYQDYRLKHIIPFLSKDKEALEIGASAGQFIVHIRDGVKSIQAIELDKDCYDYLKNEIKVDCDYNFLEESKFAKNKYDLIFSFQVLEHVPNPSSFLKTAYDSLKNNGHAFIEVPNLNDPLLSVWDVEPYGTFYYHSAHLHYFTEHSLEKVAIEAGFKKENIQFRFLQDYNVLNHLHWITSQTPQSSCDIGLSSISLTGKNEEITHWLNDEMKKLNDLYIDILIKSKSTSNILMILKK